MRTRTFASICTALTLFSLTTIAARGAPAEIKIWPGLPPGETGPLEASPNPPPRSDRKIDRIYLVNDPVVTVFRAPDDRATGTAIVVCPGGGYQILAYDLEGTEVASWLNSIGVTAVVLKYRVPRRDTNEFHRAPLQDAQRAIRLTRQNAEVWGVDPKRIGILGFSAGGHLSVLAGTHWDRATYEAVDDADRLSARPDFLVPIYPSYMTDKAAPDTLSPLVRITGETPPTFVAVAQDDRQLARDSALLFIALKDAGVTAELHIYSQGGHGYGLRPTESPVTSWPRRVEDWMRVSGLLGPRDPDGPAPAVARDTGPPPKPEPAGIDKKSSQATPSPEPSSAALRRITVDTAVPIKTFHDETDNKTIVSTAYARFPTGSRALAPNVWLRLRHDFPGKTRPDSIASIDMQLRFERSGGRHGGRKIIVLDVDGKTVELPVTRRDEESKIVKRARKRLRIKNERLWAKITSDQLAGLARARRITLMPEEMDLSREQLSLFAAMHLEITGK